MDRRRASYLLLVKNLSYYIFTSLSFVYKTDRNRRNYLHVFFWKRLHRLSKEFWIMDFVFGYRILIRVPSSAFQPLHEYCVDGRVLPVVYTTRYSVMQELLPQRHGASRCGNIFCVALRASSVTKHTCLAEKRDTVFY